jgi:hypothetical protein
MNNNSVNYRMQMHLTEQELAQFRAAFAELQNEVTEIFLEETDSVIQIENNRRMTTQQIADDVLLIYLKCVKVNVSEAAQVTCDAETALGSVKNIA